MKKSLRRTLIALAVIAALAYLGAKLYVHRRADLALRELSYAMRDVARVDYKDLDTGLDGTLTLEQVTLHPVRIQGEMYVQSLTLDAGGLDDLFQARHLLEEGQLPRSLVLRLQGLRLNFNSALFRRLQEWTGSMLVGTPLDALACGGVDHLGANEYSDMGYPYLAADAHLKLSRGRDQQAVLLSWDVNTADIARIRGEAVLRATEPPLTLGTVDDLRLNLGSMDLRYQDQGYFDARNYYCAAQRNDAVPAFLDDHMRAVAKYLRDRGAVPSPALLAGYRRLISAPGNEIHLALRPASPVPLTKLPDMTGERIMAALAPGVAVNGQALADTSIEWVEPVPQVAAKHEQAQTPHKARYYPADPSAVGELVGSFARITTFDGDVHEGLIQEAGGARVTLQRRYQGGDMSYGVDRADIKSLAVYRQTPLPAPLRPKPEKEAGTSDADTAANPQQAQPSSAGDEDRGGEGKDSGAVAEPAPETPPDAE